MTLPAKDPTTGSSNAFDILHAQHAQHALLHTKAGYNIAPKQQEAGHACKESLTAVVGLAVAADPAGAAAVARSKVQIQSNAQQCSFWAYCLRWGLHFQG